MYSVYKILNKVNGKIYIGLTKRGNPKIRLVEHCRKARNNSMLVIHCAIRKYGVENFDFEILISGLTKEECVKKEIGLIAEYKSTNRELGYNQTGGGEGMFQVTGKNHPMYGKKRPHLALLNISRKGIKLSKEHIEEIRKTSTGRKHTVKAIEAMRVTKQKAWANGVYDSKEYRAKIGNKKGTGGNARKQIICNETGVVFSSISEAVRKLNFPKHGHSNISGHLLGKWPRAYGSSFSYYNNI